MAPPRENETGRSGAVSLDGKRILIVEDQALVAMELQDLIESNGATVLGPAGRLGQALSKAENGDLDAALLDVDLNGERCWPVADVLTRRQIPFAFTTGFEASIVMPDHFKGIPTLSKPYREEEVLAALRQMFIGEPEQHTKKA